MKTRVYGRIYKQRPMDKLDWTTQQPTGEKVYSVWMAEVNYNQFLNDVIEDFILDRTEKKVKGTDYTYKPYRPINYTVSKELYDNITNGELYLFDCDFDMQYGRRSLLSVVSDIGEIDSYIGDLKDQIK